MKTLIALFLSALVLSAATPPILRTDLTTNNLSRTGLSLTNTTTKASATTNRALVVQGIASQATNIVEVQSSTGTGLFNVGPSGGVGIGFTRSVGANNLLVGNEIYIGTTTNVLMDAFGLHLDSNGSVTWASGSNPVQQQTSFYVISQGYLQSFDGQDATSFIAQRGKVTVVTGGSENPLSKMNSGTSYSNLGTAALVPFVLPEVTTSLHVGMTFQFIVEDADGIKVVTNTTKQIRIAGSISTATTGDVTSTTIGSTLTLIWTGNVWIAIATNGIWVVT